MPETTDFAEPAEPTIVAEILDSAGTLIDQTYNLDSAIVYANEGYAVRAIADDGMITKDQIQRSCDAELAAAIDCFGEDRRK